MKCENCGEECWRDSADVGVGVIYGPWGCPCGWSESEEYNQLSGPKKTDLGGIIDQFGIVTPVDSSQTFFEGFERVVIDSMADASELLSGLIASGKEFRVDGKNGQSFGRVHRRRFEEGGVPVQSIVDIKVLTDGIDEHNGPTLILPLPKCKDGGEHGPWADSLTYCVTCGYYDKSRGLEDDESDEDKYRAVADALVMRDNMLQFGTIDKPVFQVVGYARTKDLAPLLDENQPDGSYIYIGLDHPTCWIEDEPYEHLEPLYRGTPSTQTATQAAPVGNQINEDLKAAYEMGFRAAREIDPDDFEETQDYVDQRRSDLKELVSYDRSLD